MSAPPPTPAEPTEPPEAPEGGLPWPAALARRLLERAAGADAPWVVSEAAEAYARRAAGGRRLAAWGWAWWQVLSVVAWTFLDRGRRGGGGGLRPALALRLALKGLRRDPGTAALAVLILGLGMGAPAALFSLVVGATRPLPVPDGERVVAVRVLLPADGGRERALALEEVALLGRAASVESVAGFRIEEVTVGRAGRGARRVSAARVEPRVWEVLRVGPAVGRAPDPGEDAVVLGHALWAELFDGASSVSGATVRIDGRTVPVAGVAPEGFGFPLNQSLWFGPGAAPAASAGDQAPGGYGVVARLAPGAAPRGAAEELTALWRRQEAERDPAAIGEGSR